MIGFILMTVAIVGLIVGICLTVNYVSRRTAN